MKPLKLAFIRESQFEAGDKGIPTRAHGRRIEEIAGLHLNVLAGDLPLPCALLKQSAVRHNRAWMQQFVAAAGVALAPHGKTTMAPEIFSWQLEDGAWGMTAATMTHVQLYRRVGVERIIVANQVVSAHDLDALLDDVAAHPWGDIAFLVDSEMGLARARERSLARGRAPRPLRALLEVGLPGGRSGVRGAEDAVRLARSIAAAAPHVELAGIECYEGVFGGIDARATEARVHELLATVAEVYVQCTQERLFASGPILLTAGGTAYFDIVSRELKRVATADTTVVLRSGCYITLDHSYYAGHFEALMQRLGPTAPPGCLQPALELCARVHSVPEPGLAIVNFGKRDAPHDLGLPVPLWRYRNGANPRRVGELPAGCAVDRLNDQHAYLRMPADALQVGDAVGFGISHPCTLFDRWRHLLLVDDDYTVIDAIRTFF